MPNVFKSMFLCGVGLMILAVIAAVFLHSAGSAVYSSDNPAVSVKDTGVGQSPQSSTTHSAETVVKPSLTACNAIARNTYPQMSIKCEGVQKGSVSDHLDPGDWWCYCYVYNDYGYYIDINSRTGRSCIEDTYHGGWNCNSAPEKTATAPVKTAEASKTCQDYGREAGLNVGVMNNCSGPYDTYRNRTGKWCFCQRDASMATAWNLLNGDTCVTYDDGGWQIWERCSWETSEHVVLTKNISAYLT